MLDCVRSSDSLLLLHLALCVVEGIGNEADHNVDSGGVFSYWEPGVPEMDRCDLLLI
jgi:hypothetical protein